MRDSGLGLEHAFFGDSVPYPLHVRARAHTHVDCCSSAHTTASSSFARAARASLDQEAAPLWLLPERIACVSADSAIRPLRTWSARLTLPLGSNTELD